jgi:hypothetical protein
MAELDAILSRLISAGVECVLIGGYAAIAHGASYVTQDVDVCAPLDFDNLQRIAKALEGTRPRHRDNPNEIPFELERHRSGLKNLNLMTDLGPVDFLGIIPGIGDYAFAKSHSLTARLPSGNMLVLDRPTLIQSKEHAGRPRDLLVVGQLRAIEETLSKNNPGL